MNGQILYDIFFSLAIILLVPFLIQMGRKSKKVGNIEGVYNSITGSILLIFITILYLVMSFIGSPIIVYPFNVLLNIWVVMVLAVQGIYIIKKKRVNIQNNNPQFVKNKDFTFFHEIQRKVTHLVGLLLIACYFWISAPVFSMVQLMIIQFESIGANIWGIIMIHISLAYIPQMISIFSIFCALYLMTIPDIIRVYNFKASIFKKFADIMREKERNAVGPHICLMIGCLIPMLLIPNYLISIAGVVIAVFSDAAASLFGRKFGGNFLKWKFPFAKRTGKSYEGLIGGFLIAFLLPLPILLWGFNIGMSLILALIGAIVVSIIDIITPLITDNFLNPIFASFTMFGVYLLLII